MSRFNLSNLSAAFITEEELETPKLSDEQVRDVVSSVRGSAMSRNTNAARAPAMERTTNAARNSAMNLNTNDVSVPAMDRKAILARKGALYTKAAANISDKEYTAIMEEIAKLDKLQEDLEKKEALKAPSAPKVVTRNEQPKELTLEEANAELERLFTNPSGTQEEQRRCESLLALIEKLENKAKRDNVRVNEPKLEPKTEPKKISTLKEIEDEINFLARISSSPDSRKRNKDVVKVFWL